jgi:hypothetical protein
MADKPNTQEDWESLNTKSELESSVPVLGSYAFRNQDFPPFISAYNTINMCYLQ